MYKKIILIFVIWRLLLFIPLFFGNLFLSYRIGFSYTSIAHFTQAPNPVFHFLLSPWGNFDGVYYLLIAANGYTSNAGFFPLFPLLIHLLLFPLNIQAFDIVQILTGLFLSNIFFLAAMLVFYKLISLDYKSGVAMQSIIFLLIFPTSFFFASIYSESSFLLLTLLSFYFARKQKWLLAGLCGGLLSATRIVGIAIFPVLLYEYYIQNKDLILINKKTLLNILSIFISPLGLIAYMVYNNAKWGSYFYFVEAQGKFFNDRSVSSIVFFPQTIFRYLKIFTSVSPAQYEWWIALLEFSTFVFAITLLYVAFKKKVRFSYILFALLCFIVPISTGTFTGLPRYIAPLFPMFIAIALIKNCWIKVLYTVTSSVLLFILLILFSRGYFVS